MPTLLKSVRAGTSACARTLASREMVCSVFRSVTGTDHGDGCGQLMTPGKTCVEMQTEAAMRCWLPHFEAKCGMEHLLVAGSYKL